MTRKLKNHSGIRDSDRGRSRRTIASSRLNRSIRLVRLGIRTATGRAATAFLSIGAGTETKERRRREFHTRLAERYARELGDMKGAIMKLGQLFSFIDAGAVPERYRDVYTRWLGTLLGSAPPMDLEVLDEVIEAELGSRAMDAFEWFDPSPLAAASIGQVHEARLRDGSRVAVKIQYPGVAEAIESDLRNAELLATFYRLVQSIVGKLALPADPRAIMDELRERVSEELDYVIEAENQDFFRRLYEDHPFIRVPRVFTKLSTKRVLTMELAEGKWWAEAQNAPPDIRARWAEVIFRFSLGSLDRFSVFSADPHPGNYVFQDDGTVTFLDFGCIKHLPLSRQVMNVSLVRATDAGRADDVRSVLVGAGFLADDDDSDPQRLLEWMSGRAPYLSPGRFAFTHEDVRAFIRRMYDPRGEYGDLMRRMQAPKDYAMLTRVDVGLWSVLASLGGEQNWRSIVDEIWGVGPPATELGRVDAAWIGRMQQRKDWPPTLPKRTTRFAAVGTGLDFDPLEPDFTDDPYPYYERLRAQGRAHWFPPGLWMVTRYEDCVALLRDERLSSDPTRAKVYDLLVPPQWGEGSAVGTMITEVFFMMDPPDHTRIRALVAPAFTRIGVEDLRPHIERISSELLDEAGEEFDFMSQFANVLPSLIIAELLGVPLSDRSRFSAWAKDLIQIVGVDAPSDDVLERGNVTVEAFSGYVRELAADRRSSPKDDLLSALVQADGTDHGMTEGELLATCMFLLAAGQEAPANLMGNGLLALLQHPEQFRRLREEPPLTVTAVEELMRFDAPIQAVARVTKCEMEIGGKTLGRGERIVLLIGSANRDPAEFQDPDALRIDRTPNPHVAFGSGIHFCLGAPLARVQARIALPMIAKRFPSLTLVSGEIEHRSSLPVRALESLPVRAS